MKLKPGSLV